jgi:hypothetical protein
MSMVRFGRLAGLRGPLLVVGGYVANDILAMYLVAIGFQGLLSPVLSLYPMLVYPVARYLLLPSLGLWVVYLTIQKLRRRESWLAILGCAISLCVVPVTVIFDLRSEDRFAVTTFLLRGHALP